MTDKKRQENARGVVYSGVVLPVPLRRDLERMAAQRRISMSEVIRQALRDHIGREKERVHR